MYNTCLKRRGPWNVFRSPGASRCVKPRNAKCHTCISPFPSSLSLYVYKYISYLAYRNSEMKIGGIFFSRECCSDSCRRALASVENLINVKSNTFGLALLLFFVLPRTRLVFFTVCKTLDAFLAVIWPKWTARVRLLSVWYQFFSSVCGLILVDLFLCY